MPCNYYNLGNGISVIACSRGGKKCACGNHYTKLCDYPVKTLSGTCDRPLCSKCSVSVGPNRDYCPAHARVEKGGAHG
jgi:hypothetical protein